MLDDMTWAHIDDLQTRAPHTAIATFTSYVAAQRAAHRIARSGAVPVWID